MGLTKSRPEYYDVEDDVVKRLFTATFSPTGPQTPDFEHRCDWLPHFDALQQEILRAAQLLSLQGELCKDGELNVKLKHNSLVKHATV